MQIRRRLEPIPEVFEDIRRNQMDVRHDFRLRDQESKVDERRRLFHHKESIGRLCKKQQVPAKGYIGIKGERTLKEIDTSSAEIIAIIPLSLHLFITGPHYSVQDS